MNFRMLTYQVSLAVTTVFFAIAAEAHEFWIDQVGTSVQPGDVIEADLRVGQMMKGSGLIYNPQSFTKFEYYQNGEVSEVAGRLGDRPALRLLGAKDGLNIVAHMTTANKLTYETFEKFETFAQTHGQAFAAARHKERGLPDADFTEAYFRCAKALVKVGGGAGKDRATGMPFELTALTNPYTDEGSVRFILTYKGKPKADHQVDVFFKATGGMSVTMESLQTSALGEVAVSRGTGEFLLNAVVIEEPKANIAEKIGAVWVSLWASTTYVIE